jgi:hypothetical protein
MLSYDKLNTHLQTNHYSFITSIEKLLDTSLVSYRTYVDSSKNRLFLFRFNGLYEDLTDFNVECNGSIYLFPSLKCVCNPGRLILTSELLFDDFKFDFSFNDYPKVKSNIIHDGLMVSLYNYNGKWVISTANGINMDSLHIIGTTIAYKTMFKELLNDSNLKYTDFNVQYTYTFCCMYPKISVHSNTKKLILKRITDLSGVEQPIPDSMSHIKIDDLNRDFTELKDLYDSSEYGITFSHPVKNVNIIIMKPLMQYIKNNYYDIKNNNIACSVDKSIYVPLLHILNGPTIKDNLLNNNDDPYEKEFVETFGSLRRIYIYIKYYLESVIDEILKLAVDDQYPAKRCASQLFIIINKLHILSNPSRSVIISLLQNKHSLIQLYNNIRDDLYLSDNAFNSINPNNLNPDISVSDFYDLLTTIMQIYGDDPNKVKAFIEYFNTTFILRRIQN